MIRGIRFEIPNEWGNQLCMMILDKINVENYFWRVFDNDVIIDLNGKDLFERDSYCGKSFKRLLEHENFLIMFLGLLAFTSKTNETITTYQEFLDSSAEFCIMIVDCTFVDIYVKDCKVLKLFCRNAKKYAFKNIELITDENDRFNGKMTINYL